MDRYATTDTSKRDIIAFLWARYKDDHNTLRLQNEHLSGLERPYNLEDPTDPARALIDLEAKERILAEISDRYLEAWMSAQIVLNALALPYAWHKDYNEGWAKGL